MAFGRAGEFSGRAALGLAISVLSRTAKPRLMRDVPSSKRESNFLMRLPLVSILTTITFLWSISACNGPQGQSRAESEAGQAEKACKQVRGMFSAPNFCRVQNSEFYKLGGTPAVPSGWMCANPPFDQEVGYGSCINPKTKAFDFHYCAVTGIPKDGCALVPRPPTT